MDAVATTTTDTSVTTTTLSLNDCADEFFKQLGMEPGNLSPEQKKQTAVEFMGFYLVSSLRDLPELEERFKKYIQDFAQIKQKAVVTT